MEQDLLNIVRQTKYPLEAFAFVQRGLDFTVRGVHGPAGDDEPSPDLAKTTRHITGRQLCQGLRDYAIHQYGLLARTVLKSWRINSCEDFGHIVFTMVDAGLMFKTDEDSIADFIDVFDFSEAFSPRLQLDETR